VSSDCCFGELAL